MGTENSMTAAKLHHLGTLQTPAPGLFWKPATAQLDEIDYTEPHLCPFSVHNDPRYIFSAKYIRRMQACMFVPRRFGYGQVGSCFQRKTKTPACLPRVVPTAATFTLAGTPDCTSASHGRPQSVLWIPPISLATSRERSELQSSSSHAILRRENYM